MSGYGRQILYTAALGIVISLAIGLGIYYANPASMYSPASSSTTASTTSSIVDPKAVCQTLPSIPKMNAASNESSHYANFAVIEADSGPFMGMNGSASGSESMTYSTIATITNGSSTSTTAESATATLAMKVYLGQVVTITVYDCLSSETHGLAVNYYSPQGVTVAPNESSSITFTASKTGNFQVYEQISSAIHPFLQNGLLIVENNNS